MQKYFNVQLSFHLSRFLERELFEGKEYPYYLEEGTSLGKFVFALMTDKREIPERKRDPEEDETLFDLVTFELSDTLAKRSPSVVRLSQIEIYLEEQFKRSLLIWVKAQQALGINRYQAVKGFCIYYDLTSPKDIEKFYQYVKRYDYIKFKAETKDKE